MAVETDLDQTLGRFGVSADDLSAVLLAHLETRGSTNTAKQSKATLSSDDEVFVKEYGGVESLSPSELATAQRGQSWDLLREMTTMLADSWSSTQVADALGIQSASVRDRKRHGLLYAIRGAAENRFPRWQFVETVTADSGAQVRALPHLGEVLAALPASLHPLEVRDFFSVTRGWLRLRGANLSVADWLASGGPVEPVIEAARTVRLAG